MSQVRAAYNADKSALIERIKELESAMAERETVRLEVETKLGLLE